MNSLGWLYDRFEENASRNFIIWREQQFSYAWLLTHVAEWKRRLDAAAIWPGSVVAILGDYSPLSIALLLSLIARSATIVPLTASVKAHWSEFLEIAQVHVSISFMSKEEGEISSRGAQVSNPLLAQLIRTGHPGLVLYSSGSTGKSKAALHDFANLLEKFKPQRHAFVTLTFLLLDHIGGLNTLFYILSNTGTVITTESRDPDAVSKAIAKHKVELLPTSPTFLNLLLISEAWRRHDLRSLKRITYGTEVMPERTCRASSRPREREKTAPPRP